MTNGKLRTLTQVLFLSMIIYKDIGGVAKSVYRAGLSSRRSRVQSPSLPILFFIQAECIKINVYCIKQWEVYMDSGLYAEMNIDNKNIVIELYYEQAPLTVTNFVGLATGKFEGHVTKTGNFYDGISIHRVVDNFVIQGGDPDGTGAGGPGYSFPDEFDNDLKHNEAGILSMANAGPQTNGSQFFITLAPTPHLDGKHSIFGKVVEGISHIATISQGDIIHSVTIIAEGTDAKDFLDNVSWESFQNKISALTDETGRMARTKKINMLALLNDDTNLQKTKDGIFYEILQEGIGANIKNGDEVAIHYELNLYGEKQILDSSYKRGDTFSVVVGNNMVIKGWELILLELKQNNKARVIIPPELGYGANGTGSLIPPEAFLEFTMEVIAINK